MKTIVILACLIALMLPVNVFASPFLVCDPQCKFDEGKTD